MNGRAVTRRRWQHGASLRQPSQRHAAKVTQRMARWHAKARCYAVCVCVFKRAVPRVARSPSARPRQPRTMIERGGKRKVRKMAVHRTYNVRQQWGVEMEQVYAAVKARGVRHGTHGAGSARAVRVVVARSASWRCCAVRCACAVRQRSSSKSAPGRANVMRGGVWPPRRLLAEGHAHTVTFTQDVVSGVACVVAPCGWQQGGQAAAAAGVGGVACLRWARAAE